MPKTIRMVLRLSRVHRAQRLPEGTALSVTDVAMRCGFESSQYFATVFHGKTGQTPSRWRADQTKHVRSRTVDSP